MSSIKYIVASSRPWHREEFDRRALGGDAGWCYVENKVQLLAAVERGNPEFVFFLHWNWLVPQEIYEAIECVCFHMTDVPYGRGGSPLQNLIARGKTETKLTALRMTGELDAGPVYAKREMKLDGRAEDIYRRAGRLSWDIIDWLVAEKPEPTPQFGEPVFFERRRPGQSVMPMAGTLTEIYNHIRMLDAPSYPAAFIEHGAFRLEFSHAELNDGQVRATVTIHKPENNKE
jgi:methionyl-tRNA formyltransferase